MRRHLYARQRKGVSCPDIALLYPPPTVLPEILEWCHMVYTRRQRRPRCPPPRYRRRLGAHVRPLALLISSCIPISTQPFLGRHSCVHLWPALRQPHSPSPQAPLWPLATRTAQESRRVHRCHTHRHSHLHGILVVDRTGETARVDVDMARWRLAEFHRWCSQRWVPADTCGVGGVTHDWCRRWTRDRYRRGPRYVLDAACVPVNSLGLRSRRGGRQFELTRHRWWVPVGPVQGARVAWRGAGITPPCLGRCVSCFSSCLLCSFLASAVLIHLHAPPRRYMT